MKSKYGFHVYIETLFSKSNLWQFYTDPNYLKNFLLSISEKVLKFSILLNSNQLELLSMSCKRCTIRWCIWTVTVFCCFVKRSLPVAATTTPSLVMFVVMMLMLCVLIVNHLMKLKFQFSTKTKLNVDLPFAVNVLASNRSKIQQC